MIYIVSLPFLLVKAADTFPQKLGGPHLEFCVQMRSTGGTWSCIIRAEFVCVNQNQQKWIAVEYVLSLLV